MNFKNEKGSITIFVLVGLLFMTAFLIIAYGANINNSKIVKEQFNIISDIYMPNNNIVESYNEAYTDLRAKNKKILTYDSENEGLTNVNEVELVKTYADKISNYKIYGDLAGVGNLISDDKYIISIKVTDIDDEDIVEDSVTYQKEIYDIIVDSPLYENDYIDYSLMQIVRNNGTIEAINLPELSTFEDYTKIEIIADNSPEKIVIDYIGYTFE